MQSEIPHIYIYTILYFELLNQQYMLSRAEVALSPAISACVKVSSRLRASSVFSPTRRGARYNAPM